MNRSFCCHCLDVHCNSCHEFSHFAQDCPSKIPPSGTPHHQDILIPGHNTPTLKGTDHTPPTMGTDMGDISTNHNCTAIPNLTGAAAVPEGIHHTPHPTTTVVHAALQPMDAPIATHSMTHPRGIVTSHPELITSQTNITHTTIPWTVGILTPTTPTTLHGDHS